MNIENNIIYYKNELEDEFSKAQIEPKVIDGSYSYEGGFVRKVGRVFWYHIVAKPLAVIFMRVKYGHKIIGRELLKSAGKEGFFLYGNHTNEIPDAFIPTLLCMQKKSVYVIVHPNNVSIPFLGKVVPSLGGLPLPDNMDAARNFNKAVKNKIEEGKVVTIYPEAHIWPFYTKIRPFKDTSFGYPVANNTKVYCFTNTYQKRKNRKTPRMVTYVDGPFTVDASLTSREKKKALRDMVYEAMCKRSENNDVELIKYIKESEAEN